MAAMLTFSRKAVECWREPVFAARLVHVTSPTPTTALAIMLTFSRKLVECGREPASTGTRDWGKSRPYDRLARTLHSAK